MIAYTTLLLTGYNLGAMTGVSECEKTHGKGQEVQGCPLPISYTPLVRYGGIIFVYSWKSVAC